MTAVVQYVRSPSYKHLVTVALDDVTGIITDMDRRGPWHGPADDVAVLGDEPLYSHWAAIARQQAGSAQPILIAATAIIDDTIYDVTFDQLVTAADFEAGWVFTGSVAGAMAITSATLQPDRKTVRFVTAPEVNPNTVSAAYTAAGGTYVSDNANASVLADAAPAFGVVPA